MRVFALIVALATTVSTSLVSAQTAPVGIVSHLNVVSDKSQDISNLEAWKKTYIRDDMSDQDKAIAIFNTLVRYRHQANPPKEYLTSEEAGGHVHDPLKTFHVYGYGQCCCASAEVIGLSQYLGLEARGRDISRHSVPEICYSGGWHLVDGSVMNYHLKADGQLASVDEIHDAVTDWSVKHPDVANDDKKLRVFAKNEGWKNGPELLSKADQFYGKDGVNTAGWHGWPSTMQEYYKIEQAPHDFCTTTGYELNVQLRAGEKITRNFFSRGIEYTNNCSPNYYKELLNRKVLGIQTKLGDQAPGRIGDGKIDWVVPMSQLSAVALMNDNAAAAGKGVGVADASKPGTVVLRFPSSYVYVKGQAIVKATVANGGAIAVSFSDNNGLDFKPVAKIEKSGEQSIDLTELVEKRYDYRLKFELQGNGTSLDGLHTMNDFQCSQAALPAIAEGENKINFAAGAGEGTITVEGATDSAAAKKNNQLTVADFHPTLSGMVENLQMNAPKGEATFPIATPGDMKRIRISAAYRARDPKDGYEVQVSCDGGKTFKPAGHFEGGAKGRSRSCVFSDIPAGTKQALVRFAGTQANTTLIFDFDIAADYVEPNAGFAPVKITYFWDESGATKSDVHVAKTASDAYSITCGPKAVVKSFTMELAE